MTVMMFNIDTEFVYLVSIGLSGEESPTPPPTQEESDNGLQAINFHKYSKVRSDGNCYQIT